MIQNTFTILCGLPASGKSTWVQKNKKSNNVIICLDEIRKHIFGHQFHLDSEPWILAIAKTMAKLLLVQNKNIIIDSTNLLPFMRNEWKALATRFKAKINLVYFNIPYETCVERNRNRSKEKRVPLSVMRRMRGLLVEPDFDIEKYDKVIIIKNK